MSLGREVFRLFRGASRQRDAFAVAFTKARRAVEPKEGARPSETGGKAPAPKLSTYSSISDNFKIETCESMDEASEK